MEQKQCNTCGELKPLDRYYKATGMRDGRRGDCIDCNKAAKRERHARNAEAYRARARQWAADNPERRAAYQREYRSRPEVKRRARDAYYRRTHGITADDFDRMLAEQHGRCAICGRAPEREAAVHVDHDHVDGHVRGLLCLDCNQGLGKMREDPSTLLRAVVYLRQRGGERFRAEPSGAGRSR